MTSGLYRLRLADGSSRLARGSSAGGPEELLPPALTIDGLLAGTGADVAVALDRAPGTGAPPPDAVVVAPIETQEVWAAGVTYVRSRDAREQESDRDASVYDRVYRATRPELFFKSPGWRVRGPGQSISVRSDSNWNVPEPELAVVVAADLSIAGLTIGNDVSSRSIEAENPLYLPQAKIYDGSCALGPCLVPGRELGSGLGIRLAVTRAGVVVTKGEVSTEQLSRSFEDLVSYLGRAITFPVGVVLLTGTGIVPPDAFTLCPGDVVRIEVDGLGVLENPVGRPLSSVSASDPGLAEDADTSATGTD